MPSVSITCPANNNTPMPATISGLYSISVGMPLTAMAMAIEADPLPGVCVKVKFTQTGANAAMGTFTAALDPNQASGTWSLTKPTNLTVGVPYTIDADLYLPGNPRSVAHDGKTNVGN